MASFAEISNEGNENQQALEDLEAGDNPALPIPVPEDISSFWDISSEVPRPPIVSNGGRFLLPEEFISFLEPTRYAKSDALTSFNELARISFHIQAILNKIKLRRNICIHSSKIREKYHLLGKTILDTAKGLFLFIFDDFRGNKPLNVEATRAVPVQRKQVRAIAESVRAIQEEIACNKLNRVISENAQIGYQI